MIKNKDFLEYQFEKRKEYKDLLGFINSKYDLSIIVKKHIVGIEDIFIEKRKIKISSTTLYDILQKLIEAENEKIDFYIKSNIEDNRR